MSGISNLTAAQLSQASYTKLSSFVTGSGSPTLPSGWSALTSNGMSAASSDGTTQFITFINQTTKQVVITFRGSDNIANFESDLTDFGSTAYASIAPLAQNALQSIRQLYPEYTIMTDGHSLGGGMAQTFAVENGLNG